MTDINVLMVPKLNKKQGTSGIDRVIEAYHQYLPDYGIKLVGENDSFDLIAAHAGLTAGECHVAHLHGLYWTADYDSALWEYASNTRIVEALHYANQVTVPSSWVAETLQRDMRFTPHVIGHGIDWDAWQKKTEPQGDYILWNKNRRADVCDPSPVVKLAEHFPRGKFVTTFLPDETPHYGNIKIVEVIPHAEMKKLVQSAYVYLATTKESFGIGILEAMASGVPVLGYAHGGILELVEHGVNGYLAQPDDIGDLTEGLNYCLKNRAVLGANGREMARAWDWPSVVEQVADVYRLALEPEPPTVGVVIPVYNKTEEEVRRAVESVIGQSYQPAKVIVVDDGSTSGTDYASLIQGLIEEHGADNKSNIIYRRYDNRGVAIARNRGIEQLESKYVCCLDSDDWLSPEFLRVCVQALEKDRSLGVAYTGLYYHRADGSHGLSPWPPAQWSYADQLVRKNQIPTCCVFRREAWERTGGYRQRYAPEGAGEEDAEFWTRLGAYGYKAAMVEPHVTAVPKYLDLKARAARIPSPQQLTDAGLAEDWPLVKSSLFHYSWQSGQVSGDRDHRPTDWLAWHPWVKDNQHPLASYAKPFNGKPSHPVRQYDQPMISVIVPVGPGHEKTVIDALDSLEAQTFRNWECIVVWDRDDLPPKGLTTAYPYVKWRGNGTSNGAGWARNFGVSFACAPFLFFLDADDWLYPEALERHLDAWTDGEPAIIYADYVGKAVGVDTKGLARDIEVLYHFPKRDEYVLGYQAADFDCKRAQGQPELPRPFIWCNVTALVPKSWHEAIGGFDEHMESWEDVDYHWRLARAGRCYRRIPERLMVYRFYTGSRRDEGLQKHQNLVQYIERKYKGLETMPCSGCGGGAARRAVASVRATTASARRAASPQAGSKSVDIPDEEFVLVELRDGNRGDHPITGFVTKTRYGHKKHGEQFLMHKPDVFLLNKRTGQVGLVSEIFQPVDERPVRPPPVEVKAETAPPEPMVEIEDEEPLPAAWTDEPFFDLQTLPGVGPARAKDMTEAGLTDPQAILEAGEEGLTKAGLTALTAHKIIEYLSSD